MIERQVKIKNWIVSIDLGLVDSLYKVKIGNKIYWVCDTLEAATRNYNEIIEQLKGMAA
jgi:hypothetical protein